MNYPVWALNSYLHKGGYTSKNSFLTCLILIYNFLPGFFPVLYVSSLSLIGTVTSGLN